VREQEEHSGFDFDHRSSLYPHLVNRSEIHPEEAKTNIRGGETHSKSYRHANTRSSVIAPEEELFPGLAYVALAGLTGSLIARKGKKKFFHHLYFFLSFFFSGQIWFLDPGFGFTIF